jgi:hypothetical protein
VREPILRKRALFAFIQILFISSALLVFCFSAQAAPEVVTIDANNNILIEGQPFYPMGVFDAYYTSQLSDIASFGYNAVEVPSSFVSSSYLDAASANNLKVAVWFGGINGTDTATYLANALPIINAHKNHPAILGWYTIDEPSNFGFSVSIFQQVYDAFKAADPNHLVITAFNWIPEDAIYINGVDCFGIDPYPIIDDKVPGGYVLTELDEVLSARMAISDSKPVFTCPQAFGGSGSWRRAPSPVEYRCMRFLGTIGGAKASFDYTYRFMGGYETLAYSTRLKEAATQTNAEMAKIIPYISETEFNIEENNEIYVGYLDHDNKFYIVIINTSHETRSPLLTVAGLSTFGKFTDLFAETAISDDPPTVALTLAPYDVMCVEVSDTGSSSSSWQVSLAGECGPNMINLALGATPSVSSQLSSKYGVQTINDGSFQTQWASTTASLPQWLRLDFAQPVTMNAIYLTTPSSTFYSNWKTLQITMSDGTVINAELEDHLYRKELYFSDHTVSWIKLTATSLFSVKNYVGCVEVEVFNMDSIPIDLEIKQNN